MYETVVDIDRPRGCDEETLRLIQSARKNARW